MKWKSLTLMIVKKTTKHMGMYGGSKLGVIYKGEDWLLKFPNQQRVWV